jgi:hypothetical protein
MKRIPGSNGEHKLRGSTFHLFFNEIKFLKGKFQYPSRWPAKETLARSFFLPRYTPTEDDNIHSSARFQYNTCTTKRDWESNLTIWLATDTNHVWIFLSPFCRSLLRTTMMVVIKIFLPHLNRCARTHVRTYVQAYDTKINLAQWEAQLEVKTPQVLTLSWKSWIRIPANQRTRQKSSEKSCLSILTCSQKMHLRF